MKKHFWEKSCRYSIRKLTVGTASVLLGAVFLSSHTVSADGIEVQQNDPSIVETTIKPDSGSEQIEPTETTKPALVENPSTESKPAEETQPTSSQASSEAVIDSKENKESEKTELPVTKQENYQLNYDQPTAPSGLEDHNLIAQTITVETTRTVTRSWQRFVKLSKMETAKKPNNWLNKI